MRGFVGKFEEEGVFPHVHQSYLYTHHKLEVEYNEDHIIFARIKTLEPILLHDDLQVVDLLIFLQTTHFPLPHFHSLLFISLKM